ncbi:MAG: UDP-N-acetylmuramoyl-L-alanyl-D-glutamate--2,6-diaminopimelate ligase [Fibrobacteria bacterium]|nr:UDP-N-acetylmuramoyl-L-alanyl-D-glutamate--2,6-diaminopimelate ligase [Fibrobacteria bacterium]
MLVSRLLHESGLELPLLADLEISDVQLDSRKIVPGSLFIAMQGTNDDGARFISDAKNNGAALVLTDAAEQENRKDVYYVDDLRGKASAIANVFFGQPLKQLECFAVTGTNGKTTVASLVSSILKESGRKVITLGTIGNYINDTFYPTELTTPDAVELCRLASEGVRKGCDTLVMEVSSHALSQDRTGAFCFKRAIFTNLTQDHLDYHKDFENYFSCKKKLFTHYLSEDGVAIVNMDNDYGWRLAGELSCPVIRFSCNSENDAECVLVKESSSLEKTTFTLRYEDKVMAFDSELIGRFNLENLIAAVSLGLSLDVNVDDIASGIQQVKVPGRIEALQLPGGGIAVVDYAHTPDALDRVLKSIRNLTPGQLGCVFGCGGDRDKTKRPLMAKAAETNSDFVVITSDNPRTEEADSIINDILKGIGSPAEVRVVPDRALAIREALKRISKGDCVVIAGKGHEDYQILGTEKIHFSDREQIEHWIKEQSYA